MAGSESVRLNNADFRKFLSSTESSSNSSTKPTLKPKSLRNNDKKPTDGKPSNKRSETADSTGSSRMPHKPKNVAKSSDAHKEDALSLQNIMEKYRDRAKERRTAVDGGGGFNLGRDSATSDTAASAAAVHTNMIPGPYNNVTAGDYKRRMVEESKFLGGDMEHTHLVRGLDYALLHKVRAELDEQHPAKDEADQKAAPVDSKNSAATGATAGSNDFAATKEAPPTFITRIGRDIYDLHFNLTYPERNELFAPGRMRFGFDLQDPEFTGSPTILISSKAEVKQDDAKTVSTSDLVIDKLTEIFSYMRRGLRQPKQHAGTAKRDQQQFKQPRRPLSPRAAAAKDIDIFDDANGRYSPTNDDQSSSRGKNSSSSRSQQRHATTNSRNSSSDAADRHHRESSSRSSHHSSKPQHRSTNGSYFSNKSDRNDRDSEHQPHDADDHEARRLASMNAELAKAQIDSGSGIGGAAARKRKGIADQTDDSYAECYPGYDVSVTANDDDSDDDDDGGDRDLAAARGGAGDSGSASSSTTNKGDGSNKKHQKSRWDFDSQEEYSRYMGQLQVTSKAASQFGLKASDGRRPRKAGKGGGGGDAAGVSEKVKLDQQWNKIQKIMDTKRGSGGSTAKE